MKDAMVNGYDPTISTRAAAIESDVQRTHSGKHGDPELRLAQERTERAYAMKLGIVAGLALAVFILIWWLVVQ